MLLDFNICSDRQKLISSHIQLHCLTAKHMMLCAPGDYEAIDYNAIDYNAMRVIGGATILTARPVEAHCRPQRHSHRQLRDSLTLRSTAVFSRSAI